MGDRPRRLILAACCLGLATCSSSPSPVAPSVPSPAVSAPPVVVPPPVLPLPTRGPDFNQTFWTEFVYNGLESPNALSPLRRWSSPPSLYLKTKDEQGFDIDAETLNMVERVFREAAPVWTGGQFGLAGIQRGTGTMDGQHGWITVKWPNPRDGDVCGRATVAQDGGWIWLNYQSTSTGCACSGFVVRPRTVRHELGHALGYWHTDSVNDVMSGIGVNGCDATPSSREQYHATLAYQSPLGSTGALPSHATPIVIVD